MVSGLMGNYKNPYMKAFLFLFCFFFFLQTQLKKTQPGQMAGTTSQTIPQLSAANRKRSVHLEACPRGLSPADTGSNSLTCGSWSKCPHSSTHRGVAVGTQADAAGCAGPVDSLRT